MHNFSYNCDRNLLAVIKSKIEAGLKNTRIILLTNCVLLKMVCRETCRHSIAHTKCTCTGYKYSYPMIDHSSSIEKGETVGINL